MEPNRVLHVVPNMQAGGLETFIMNVYRKIDREKIQFDFLVHYKKCCFYDDEITKLGGRLFRLTVREDHNYIKYLRDLHAFFSSHSGYRIVHGHMPSLALIYLAAAKKAGVEIRICHSHTTSSGKTLKGLLKLLPVKAARLYANTYFACSAGAGWYLFGHGGFTVIPNGVDLALFEYNEKIRKRVRMKFHIEDQFVVGHVGRFEEEKNHVFLIRVFAEIVMRKPDSVLFLVGTGSKIRQIERMVRELSLEDKVFFLGVRHDVYALYQAMDAFVLPSLHEAQPVVVIEAQAARLPVVVSAAVSQESTITDAFVRMPQNAPPTLWADTVIRSAQFDRSSFNVDITGNSYDINKTVETLFSFYTEIYQAVSQPCLFT